jgi:hypothetical protein
MLAASRNNSPLAAHLNIDRGSRQVQLSPGCCRLVAVSEARSDELWSFSGLAAVVVGIVALYGQGRRNHPLGAVALAYAVCMVVGVSVYLALAE